MKRRSALKTLTIATGSGLFLTPTIFSNCQSDTYQPVFFDKKEISLLNEIGETILPQTIDSPGAKALQVANFIDVYVKDCYTLENQEIIQKGLLAFAQFCQQKFKQPFLSMSKEQRHNCLVELDEMAKKSESNHYFLLLKKLVIFTYFTSKEGMEKALEYLPIPGKYIGNYPTKTDTKAWAL